jgi:hypothetical protein
MALSNRASVPRKDNRSSVALEGRVQLEGDQEQPVAITNLSGNGCSITGASLGVSKAKPLQVWIGGHGPLPAKVRWAKNGRLGLRFEEPLAATMLAELQAPGEQANVIHLRRDPLARLQSAR